MAANINMTDATTYTSELIKGPEFFQKPQKGIDALSKLSEKVDELAYPMVTAINKQSERSGDFSFYFIRIIAAFFHDLLFAPTCIEAKNSLLKDKKLLENWRKQTFDNVLRDVRRCPVCVFGSKGKTLVEMAKEKVYRAPKNLEEGDKDLLEDAKQIIDANQSYMDKDLQLIKLIDKLNNQIDDFMEKTIIPDLYNEILNEFEGDEVRTLEFMNFLTQTQYLFVNGELQSTYIDKMNIDSDDYMFRGDQEHVTLRINIDIKQKQISWQMGFKIVKLSGGIVQTSSKAKEISVLAKVNMIFGQSMKLNFEATLPNTEKKLMTALSR